MTVLLLSFLRPSTFDLRPLFAQENGRGSFDGISMDFQDAELKDVLKIFSQQSGLNFIADEKIIGKKVTLYLDKVSIEDALYNIMRAQNLIYEKQEGSDVFVVEEAFPPPVEPEPTVPTITKVYVLRYAQVGGVWGGAGAEAPATTSQTSTSTTSSTTGEIKPSPSTGLGGDNISNVIKSLLSEHGRLVSEKRTNSLIITDIQEQFPLIEKIIAELDVAVPQVAIEAEIIETVGTTLDRIGLEYGGTLGQMGTYTAPKRETQFPYPGHLAGPTTKPSFTVGTLDTSAFKIALELLSKDSKTKFLARPKVITLNNQTAEIKISAETAVASISTITAAQGGVSQSTTQAERMETGIILKVTPQVNERDRVVTMLVEPEVIRPEDSKFFSGSFVDPLRRKVKTTVMLKDNETLIMGGLIESQVADSRRKVPVLGDIPIVGTFFRKKVADTTDRELIIFVTPHIIVTGESRSALVAGGNQQGEQKAKERKEKIEQDLEALELIKSINE